MDVLYVTTALPKWDIDWWFTLNFESTACVYVILRHPNHTLLMMQRFRGLVAVYGALFASGLSALSQGRMSSDTHGNGL